MPPPLDPQMTVELDDLRLALASLERKLAAARAEQPSRAGLDHLEAVLARLLRYADAVTDRTPSEAVAQFVKEARNFVNRVPARLAEGS